jgi:cell division protein ZapA
MAQVTLDIGGRQHAIACRDGEEARLTQLGRMVAELWPAGLRAAANIPGERVSQHQGDEQHRAPSGAAVSEAALARIADRLEALADALEQTPPSA